MNQEMPLPELSAAVQRLRDSDDFQSVLIFLAQERDRFFADLRQAETPHDVMKITGSVATLHELLETLDAGNRMG